MKNRNYIFAILFFILLLSSCGKSKSQKAQTFKSADDVQIIDSREINIDGAYIVSLSPNGNRLAVTTEDRFCIYLVETVSVETCIDLGDTIASIAPESIAWSPDGLLVAFTENISKELHESDLWILEIESGNLNNITEDEVSGIFIGKHAPEDGEFSIDMVPTWSPDSKRIIFSRSTPADNTQDSKPTTTLFSIKPNGDNLKEMLSISNEELGVLWLPPLWFESGEKLLYQVGPDEIWSAGKNGEKPEKIFGEDPKFGPPNLIDVSKQANIILINFSLYPTRPYSLLDIETGDAISLDKDTFDIEKRIINATFSPGGNLILFINKESDDQYKLVVRDIDGEIQNELFTSTELLGISTVARHGLFWAKNNLVFISTSRSSGLLLTLGTDRQTEN